MSRSVVVMVACALMSVLPGVAGPAWAQESAQQASRLSFVNTPAVSFAESLQDLLDDQMPLPAEVGQLPAPIVQPYRRIETGASPLMMSLYVSTAVTQALDVHSTLKALGHGAVETNPLLTGITGNKAAFIAVKSAVAAGSIYAASRLAKRNKVAAVASLVAINVAYGLVAHHNYRVARDLR